MGKRHSELNRREILARLHNDSVDRAYEASRKDKKSLGDYLYLEGLWIAVLAVAFIIGSMIAATALI